MTHHATRTLHCGHRVSLRAIGAMAATLGIATAFAVDAAAGDAESRYQQERAACTDGSSQQDRATCLKEAGAARDEARGGRLGAGQAASEANATVRCNALPAKDRSDCVARIQGAGTTSGSVRDGGIYRELVTTTPASPVTAPAAPPTAPQE